MRALQVDLGFNIMTFRAVDLLERGVVFGFGNIAVAADALIIGMNGGLEDMTVNKRLSIRLAVAFQAGGILDIDCMCRNDQPEAGKNKQEQTSDAT